MFHRVGEPNVGSIRWLILGNLPLVPDEFGRLTVGHPPLFVTSKRVRVPALFAPLHVPMVGPTALWGSSDPSGVHCSRLEAPWSRRAEKCLTQPAFGDAATGANLRGGRGGVPVDS